ncbi:sigma-54 dependent transcriptional regulator [Caballeronia sp. J97]|uniref:sigma-54 interaction domain-containing protein n=1 Tax=Caballeronia sp. J97 TaxID=2805429 RepID=UPI002AB229D5|nr:sigma-54 dependent transcriptional regulator [Caballeronia sp. J97]
MNTKTASSWFRELRTTNLIGEARTFREAIADLPRIAQSDASIIVCGETGTGKELIARAIHYHGRRADFPFVPINCGSFTDTLLEEELFGHERGAFTDARNRRAGLIAEAEGGTLFLDEIDSLPMKAQVDLLRVIQDRSLRAIGSNVQHSVNIQIVAATNVPLEELVDRGQLRSDLYYRLAVFVIQLPPLRERKEDIPSLAEHFLAKHLPAARAPLALSPEARRALLSWHWPGNVRELENVIIRGIHLARTGAIGVADLRLPKDACAAAPQAEPSQTSHTDTRPMVVQKRELIEGFERRYLAHLLARHEGNVSRAAQTAGKERRELGRLLHKYGLDPGAYRRGAAA